MSQSKVSTQLAYSLLATKHIHETKTNISHKFLRFLHQCLKHLCTALPQQKEIFMWNNSQSAATHLGWKGCCLSNFGTYRRCPTYFPTTFNI
jgi:hypothetical protein